MAKKIAKLHRFPTSGNSTSWAGQNDETAFVLSQAVKTTIIALFLAPLEASLDRFLLPFTCLASILLCSVPNWRIFRRIFFEVPSLRCLPLRCKRWWAAQLRLENLSKHNQRVIVLDDDPIAENRGPLGSATLCPVSHVSHLHSLTRCLRCLKCLAWPRAAHVVFA